MGGRALRAPSAREKDAHPKPPLPCFFGLGVRTVPIAAHARFNLSAPVGRWVSRCGLPLGVRSQQGPPPRPSLRSQPAPTLRSRPPALDAKPGRSNTSTLRSTSTAAPSPASALPTSCAGRQSRLCRPHHPRPDEGFKSAIESQRKVGPLRRPITTPLDPAPRSRQGMSIVSAFAKTSWVNLLGRKLRSEAENSAPWAALRRRPASEANHSKKRPERSELTLFFSRQAERHALVSLKNRLSSCRTSS